MTGGRGSRGRLIALDCDGVMLDYHEGYRRAWKSAFGDTLVEVRPSCYWARDRFGARNLALKEERRQLRGSMGSQFWRSLAPLPGAVEACHELVRYGYELVCVTALSDECRGDRLENLQTAGFPIERVYATGDAEACSLSVSPKAAILAKLQPCLFVDDYAPYLRGVSRQIHRALILGRPEESPNVGEDLALADSTHHDLVDVVRWWRLLQDSNLQPAESKSAALSG